MAARKPSERRHGGGEELSELNLVPIMAIMVILVPMLIYMFTFHQIKVQRVMAPRRGTGAKKPVDEQKQKELNLTIMIADDGFQLTWEEALMTDTAKAPKLGLIKVKDEACGDPESEKDDGQQGCIMKSGGCYCYDFPGLYAALVDKKSRFSTPEKPERRVNITAKLNIPWSIVSRTIDAATCVLEQPSYNTYEEYVAAKVKPGEPVKVPGLDDPYTPCEELFPNVVFAMAE